MVSHRVKPLKKLFKIIHFIDHWRKLCLETGSEPLFQQSLVSSLVQPVLVTCGLGSVCLGSLDV